MIVSKMDIGFHWYLVLVPTFFCRFQISTSWSAYIFIPVMYFLQTETTDIILWEVDIVPLLFDIFILVYYFTSNLEVTYLSTNGLDLIKKRLSTHMQLWLKSTTFLCKYYERLEEEILFTVYWCKWLFDFRLKPLGSREAAIM